MGQSRFVPTSWNHFRGNRGAASIESAPSTPQGTRTMISIQVGTPEGCMYPTGSYCPDNLARPPSASCALRRACGELLAYASIARQGPRSRCPATSGCKDGYVCPAGSSTASRCQWGPCRGRRHAGPSQVKTLPESCSKARGGESSAPVERCHVRQGV
jgi:hypothetical protein